jgi:hypothetical protein
MPSIAHREDSGKYSLPFARNDNTVISTYVKDPSLVLLPFVGTSISRRV